jgi:hypothetical protein
LDASPHQGNSLHLTYRAGKTKTYVQLGVHCDGRVVVESGDPSHAALVVPRVESDVEAYLAAH